ncbi:EH signature domain-containing protein [Faunimonas sp. B44]|uniref:EH signature domain-containing protein n=1 Tax=Faunimonas sp. B44 TaxID=3461493 RepID=UPI0040440846
MEQRPPEDMATRRGKDYDAISNELRTRLREGGVLSWKEARDAAWCLWTTDPALAAEPALLAAILARIEPSERRKPYRALAAAFLRDFDLGRPGIRDVARTLATKADEAGRPWSGLQKELALFDIEEGPAKVGRVAIQSGNSPSEVLRANGLGALGADTGFGRACVAAILRHLRDGAEPDPLERLELVRQVALNESARLRFDELAPLVADALLIPFGNTMPDKILRDRFLGLLISLFGDPRINDPRLPHRRWVRMPDAEAIVRRWLTEQSLRQFLDIVDRVAVERMWKYRRAFWEAVYHAGLVEEAWVVFDTYGVEEARRAFGRAASFGQFQGGGRKQVQKGHAVLLLRVGRGVVADWSHNGKCNIWNDASERGAPVLYRKYYTSSEFLHVWDSGDAIDRSTFSTAHMGPETYSWQRKVAAKLHNMTGVRISPSSYVVR